MRQTTSLHCQSLRARYWKSAYYRDPALHWNLASNRNDFRPALNISRFILLLKDTASPFTRKRQSLASSSSDSRRPKRAKFASDSSASSSVGSEGGSEDANEVPVADAYPALSLPPHTLSEGVHNSDDPPVYHHVSEVEYTKSVPEPSHDQSPTALNWVEQERQLVEILEEFIGDSSEPRPINLGKVFLVEHDGRVVAALRKPSEPETTGGPQLEWLMLVSALHQSANLEALGPGKECEDLLATCITLRSAGRVAIDSSLTVVVLPPTSSDDDDSLPFRLQISVSVSPILSILSSPITRKTGNEIFYIENAQRRFLEAVFPSSLSSFGEKEINIPFFYSILGPAPSLPSEVAEAAMQPKVLLPTLLPFQRRSVGWLLGREGKTVTPSGEIVIKHDNSDSELPLFWEEISFGGEPYYYNRLTGSLTSSRPSFKFVMGGILAEEPGLGKTLMCISLILLNPAPGRNPSVTSWDPIANLEVKQIMTTLIVVPPSLASQWADELALHAPSLKVFIYKGWSTVSASLLAAAGKAGKARKNKTKTKRGERPSASGKGKGSATNGENNRSRSKAKRKYDSDQENAAHSDMEVDAPEEEPEDTFDWCSFINTFDVCITTYSVLRHDLNVARLAPVRPRREDVMYSSADRVRSPLVIVEWYRVIMDEVQMVSGGKLEEMVSLLPRLSSFAVSGTPARSKVNDLIRVIYFLRVHGHIGLNRMWNRLLKPGFASHFASLFQQYAIRTMKSTIEHELTIPRQTRFLVSIDLGRVERHVYDQALEAALVELGVDARGVAAAEGWEVDSAVLRVVIRRLRGICTHPQVGQLQRLGENLYKQGALKTMSEVLWAMKDQNWRNLLDDRHQKVHSLIRFAGLKQHDEGDRTRYQHALEALLLAEQEVNQIIDDVKVAIAEQDKKGEVLKQEALARKNARQKGASPAPDGYFADKGKGRVLGEKNESTQDSAEDKDIPRNPAGEEHASKKRALQLRLREYKVTLHKVKFLQGDVNHVLGESHSKAENAAYEAAEEIRQDLLRSYETGAIHAMDQLTRDFAAKGLTEKSLLIPVPFGEQGGIRSFDLMVEANEVIEQLLNKQSHLLWSWRAEIYELLTQKLSSENGEVDGQEYTRTLETQGEAEVFLQAFAALLADRREVLVAERTLLAAHDVREKKHRHTQAARRAAAALQTDLAVPEDVEMQPEHEVLHETLNDERKEIIQQLQGRAIKSIVFDLNTVAARILVDKDPEKIIAKKCVADLRRLIYEQSSLMDKLEGDLNQFRKAFNERILYFRQLQELSDSVAEVVWQGGVDEAMAACEAEQNLLEGKINTNKARLRYLNHLAQSAEEGTVDENEEICILCQCELVRGFITPCAHVFCEECLTAWMGRSVGKACPVCRVYFRAPQMQRFTMQGDKKCQPPKPVNGEAIPKSRREIAYNMIDPDLFAEIQKMESHGSYGNKIQTLIRHLLYLQMVEPEAKSIVFSAWADSLHIIEHALETNGIGFLRIDQNNKKESAAKRFKIDPTISVLLLHGERENAGLNLTCASRVFLVESVVHHGFELQAIARIDRMSQQRETEVYCYYAEDTVERNILDLAARQGLSLYTKDNSEGTLHVSSFTQDVDGATKTVQKQAAAKKKQKVQKGDFVLKTDDMLAILFPHMFEDVEFLLPEDALEGSQSQESGQSQETARPRLPVHVNAIAGPSRIPLP